MVTKKTQTKKTSKKTGAKKKSSTSSKHKKAKIVYKQPSQKKDYFFPLLLLVVAVIIVGFVSNGTFFIDKLTSKSPSTVEGDQTVLVTVNGEPIYQAELDEYWGQLPPQVKLQMTKDDLLEEFIQERLLIQEADKQGIKVTESEVDEYITAQLSASGLSYEQFEALVKQQGMTVDRMKDIYKRQLKLAKLFEEQSSENLTSTQEEIQAYYDANKEGFYQQEQVTVRHILVPVNENVDEATALERVETIEAQLEASNNEDFCDLVSEYSGDPGSVDNCGEYTFAKGVMVPEFEEAGFDMETGEVRTVKTSFGYHIMIKDATVPAQYLDLEDEVSGTTISELIERALAEEKARAVYDKYITELKEDADIYYVSEEEPEMEDTTTEESMDENEITGNVVEEQEEAQEVLVEIS